MKKLNIKACWRYYLIVVTILVSGQVLKGQPSSILTKDIIFSQLPLEMGLSQNSVNCMLQDREGFLWIGTWSGLIRYDGYSSIVYHAETKPNKIKSDKITAIYEDHKGYLWVGTQMEGVFRFDKCTGKFTQFKNIPTDKSSLSNNNVWCIREDAHQNLWVGTEDGLNRLDTKTNTFNVFNYSASDGTSISSNHISDMYLSGADGKFWIGTAKGLNLLLVDKDHNYSFKKYKYEGDVSGRDPEAHNYIFKLSELTVNGKSTLWFCTASGLKKLEGEKIQNFTMEGMPASCNTLLSILAVSGNVPYIIVGSEKGLSFFDPAVNKFTRFLNVHDEHLNLSHTTVTALCLDRGGVLWVGTKKGLNKLDTYAKNFEAYKTAVFDKNLGITTGVRGSFGDGYWISTLGGGLYKFKNKKFTRVKLNGKNGNDFVTFIQTLYTSRDGSVWFGTAGEGVYRFYEKDFNAGTGEVKKIEHYNLPVLGGNFIMSITEDNLGNIWIGNWRGGLSEITPAGEVRTFAAPMLANVPLVSMYADRTGTLWIGTRGNGLYKIRYKEHELDIRRLHSTDSVKGNLTNNFINAICEDHNGLLWIGTEGGIQSFDARTEVFRSLKMMDHDGVNVVTSIQEDNHGKLWIAGPEGLRVVDPENARYVKKYDYHDRILGGFFYNNASFKDETGRLLFGGSDGFNIIEPGVVVQNPAVPQVMISDFQLFNKSVRYGYEGAGRAIFQKPLSQTKQVTLRSKENSIAFEFAALDYAAPEKISYAYKLDGFDEHWNYTNYNRRFAVYTNLEEGSYTFKVKAANSDGLWNGQVKELRVVINPPWWKTNWAIAAYFMTVLLALYLFRRLILMRANFRHDLSVERLQRENMEKLNQAKLQFFTNISHEFRTPLTLILGPLQNLMDGKKRDKEERDQLLRINNNANRLLRLVNQLLDFRKAESGKLKLGVSEGNIVWFIREIKLSFDALAENMKIHFSFTATSNIIKVWFDPDQFEKIMFNLLSNAFKHTPEGGMIKVQITETFDGVIIVVEDNGKGIKREHFENIFQTFFSYNEDKHHTGTGIGLAFVKSLVDMHHGELTFESTEHVSTRFVLALKKGSSHFDAAELYPVSGDVESMDHYPSLLSEIVDTTEDSLQENELVLGNNPCLLIVEDNDDVRAYIKLVFTGVYTILEAANGEQGLALALERIPDVIISDVMMPVMDGIKLCAQLKSNTKTSHIPIVLLTARTSLIFKVEGLESGADDYITKPFNPNILKLKVRNLIHTREVMQKMFQDSKVLNIEPNNVTLTSIDEIFIKNALDGIEKNISNSDYGVDDLGRDVGMSRTQLYRKLKALTGQSANEFIRTIRLKRAAQLLEQDQLTIAEITHKVGFSDLQYFRDCFKKLFGVIPSEYVHNSRLELQKKNS